MKILILGYGKMGRIVERCCNARSDIEISGIINNSQELQNHDFQKDEVIIDFSNAAAFLKNIDIIADKKVNIVTGTTGWFDYMDDIRHKVEASGIKFLYGENFSPMVNIFWNAVGELSRLVHDLPDSDVAVHEAHHKMKKDAPSGTSRKTENIIMQNFPRKNTVVNDISGHGAFESNELSSSSSRIGSNLGKQSAFFDDLSESIDISVTYKSRDGFANGSIDCALWLQNQPSGFYSVDDYWAAFSKEKATA